jgi:hypothetical protein
VAGTQPRWQHWRPGWPSDLAGLTCLTLWGGELADGEELMYLPPSLKQLDLACMRGLQQVPRGLSRLTGLETLGLGCNQALCELPGWLSLLGRSRCLGLGVSGVVDEQEVLAHMPGLRRVSLPEGAAATVVFGRAAPLCSPDFAPWSGMWE